MNIYSLWTHLIMINISNMINTDSQTQSNNCKTYKYNKQPSESFFRRKKKTVLHANAKQGAVIPRSKFFWSTSKRTTSLTKATGGVQEIVAFVGFLHGVFYRKCAQTCILCRAYVIILVHKKTSNHSSIEMLLKYICWTSTQSGNAQQHLNPL